MIDGVLSPKLPGPMWLQSSVTPVDNLTRASEALTVPEAKRVMKKVIERVSPHGKKQATMSGMFNWREFDPAMLGGNDELAVELTTYRDNLDALLQKRGMYVVITGPRIHGVYRGHRSAMKVAYRFAPGPVLVKKIVEEEPVREIGHIMP
jgi:hypothetical protein